MRKLLLVFIFLPLILNAQKIVVNNIPFKSSVFYSKDGVSKYVEIKHEIYLSSLIKNEFMVSTEVVVRKKDGHALTLEMWDVIEIREEGVMQESEKQLKRAYKIKDQLIKILN